MRNGLLMSLRLLWVLNLVTGALYYFRVAVPLNVHMYLGFAIALIMIVLGIMGLRAVAGMAVATIVCAILLPVVGILQLTHIGTPSLALYQVLHVIIGVAAIALAEILGKRMRLASVA